MSAAGCDFFASATPCPAGLEGLVKATVTIFGEHEVAAKRPRGQRRRLPDDGSDVF
jgi:hypothetical protein